ERIVARHWRRICVPEQLDGQDRIQQDGCRSRRRCRQVWSELSFRPELYVRTLVASRWPANPIKTALNPEHVPPWDVLWTSCLKISLTHIDDGLALLRQKNRRRLLLCPLPALAGRGRINNRTRSWLSQSKQRSF